MTTDTLRYWTASKTLLNPATPAEEADEAGLALVNIAQYCRNERLSLLAYDSLALASERGLLNFTSAFALEA